MLKYKIPQIVTLTQKKCRFQTEPKYHKDKEIYHR